MQSLYMRPMIATLTGGALILCISIGGALAADLPRYTPPPAPVAVPELDITRQFYVRGDVGIGRFIGSRFHQSEVIANGGSFISSSVGDSVYLGSGIGWHFNNRFRIDLTGEYRSNAHVKAMDNLNGELVDPAGVLQANTLYQGRLTSIAGLVNGYWDVMNWRGFTPYVGAGVGLARNSMTGFTTATSSNFTDAVTGAQTLQSSNGVARDQSKINFAWALMAGASYDLSPNAKLDLGYRYLNLGSSNVATTGVIDCVCGTVGGPLKASSLKSHEFRMGIRWLLDSEPRYPTRISAKY